MAVIHISEEDAARDFASVLARVRSGAEVVIESNGRPVAVIKSPEPPRRSISEYIALAEAYERELGWTRTMPRISKRSFAIVSQPIDRRGNDPVVRI